MSYKFLANFNENEIETQRIIFIVKKQENDLAYLCHYLLATFFIHIYKS